MNYTLAATPARLQTTIEALQARGILVDNVQNKEASLSRLQSLIPEGASIMTAASVTLQEIGFEEQLISGKHKWNNLKAEIFAETDPQKQLKLRKQSSLADYYIGSVHAITEAGQVLTASGSGSQLAPYAFSSSNVIWVVGVQKLVSTLDEGLQRIREYCAPKVEEKGKVIYGRDGVGTIGKILIFENESPHVQRKVHLILVNDVLGF